MASHIPTLTASARPTDQATSSSSFTFLIKKTWSSAGQSWSNLVYKHKPQAKPQCTNIQTNKHSLVENFFCDGKYDCDPLLKEFCDTWCKQCRNKSCIMFTFVYPLIKFLSWKKLQYLEWFMNKNYTYMVKGFITTSLGSWKILWNCIWLVGIF